MTPFKIMLPPRASLLGLPLEIRLMIYSHVYDHDTDTKIIPKRRWESTGYQVTPFQILDCDHQLEIPWLNMMLTCRTIASDIGQSTQATAGDCASTTYRLDLSTSERQGNIDNLKWRRLPCAPKHVRVLDVTLRFANHQHFGGNGGPRDIIPCLYQTLNWILHSGPLLDPTRPLMRHMELRELKLRCAPSKSPRLSEEPLDSSDRECLTVRSEVESLVRSLCDTGLLYGYVDTVKVFDALGQTCEIPVKFVEGARVPELWNGYGFEWGLQCETIDNTSGVDVEIARS